MFDVRAVLGRNRLVVTLAGRVEGAEARAGAEVFLAELARLRRGFDIISDIAGLESIDAESLAQVKVLDEEVVRLGGRRVVRVVGKSAQAAVQMEKMSREAHLEVYLAFSRAEAERMLDGEFTL